MNSCTCEECKEMCRRPCWPEPWEASGLLEMGLARKLMLDYWYESDRDERIFLLCPACPGYESHDAPYWPSEGCVFQTRKGLCSIHDSGFKPREGREAICGEFQDGLHEAVARTWDCEEGRELVERWKQLVGM
jgi:hypothetical protein